MLKGPRISIAPLNGQVAVAVRLPRREPFELRLSPLDAGRLAENLCRAAEVVLRRDAVFSLPLEVREAEAP